MQIICSKCGKEIDNKSEKCPYCNNLTSGENSISNEIEAKNNASALSIITFIIATVNTLILYIFPPFTLMMLLNFILVFIVFILSGMALFQKKEKQIWTKLAIILNIICSLAFLSVFVVYSALR